MFSATSEQRLALGETSRGSDNLKQFLPFWAIFLATFRLRTHIKHDKVNDFLKKFDRSMQFLKCFGGLLSNIRTGNRLKRRQRWQDGCLCWFISMNRNGWLETTFICEQLFKAKFVNANNEEYSFWLTFMWKYQEFR